MKFIHVADLHLGHLFQGIKNISEDLQEQFHKSTFKVFEKIINEAIAEKVDFVVLAGDEYDRNTRSLKEQTFLRKQFERLDEENINVYVIYGNHDYVSSESTFLKFPDNVYSFGTEVSTVKMTTKNNEIVAISGFSYPQKNISKNYLPDYPNKETSEDYHIGLFHGMQSSQSNNYAPFELSEMISKGYDYWALGHIHKREILNQNPPIIYAGDPQGLNRKETGKKGYYLVESINGVLTTKFKETQLYLWDDLNIEATETDDNNELIKKIIKASEDKEEGTLLSVTLNNAQVLDKSLIEQIDDDDFLKLIQNNLENSYIYPYKLILKFNDQVKYKTIESKYWTETEEDIFNLKNIKNLMGKNLKKYNFLREHIESNENIESIKKLSSNYISKKISE